MDALGPVATILLLKKSLLMSAFLLRFKANYLAKCVATPIFLFGFQYLLQRSTFSAWCQFGAKTSVFSRHRL